MTAAITPSVINGMITAPAAKSAMQRACALALLNNGQTIIQNPGNSNDDLAAINIIRHLGAVVARESGNLLVVSNGKVHAKEIIDCGESGLSFRMFAPIAALGSNSVVLTGSGSLLKRPMHFIDEIFPLLDIHINSNNGFLPIELTGPLHPKDITVDGSSSSQYLTGLLFAFAAAAKRPLTITVTNLKSKPYIDLSLHLLHHFGYEVNQEAYVKFHIKPVEIKKKKITYYTEADWSSASFLLVAAAIAGAVEIKGLDKDSMQADKSIVRALQDSNADIVFNEDHVIVSNLNNLQAFEFDATHSPDLFPPLVALAAYCDGVSKITGVSRLAGKESNRGQTLQAVFKKMGIEIIIHEDIMLVKGGTGVHAATVSSYHDHRIAMACAVAGLMANGKIFIRNAEAVNKSYPEFFRHLEMLGAEVSLSQEI